MKQSPASTSFLSPFNGKTIVLELGREIGFKAKQELTNYLREQQAHISYILTASTDYILVSNNIDSYKVRRAKQLGLPVINVDYVYEYRRLQPGQTQIDINKFIVKSIEDQENFTNTGTISITGSQQSAIRVNKFDLNKIKFWNSDDVDLPRFDELTNSEIAKCAIFKETNDNSDVFFVLELQIIPEQYYDRTTNDYRLRFRYEKQTITNDGQRQDKKVLVQYAYSDDTNEQQQLFASYYYRIANMPRVTRIREMLPDKLGSKLLLRSLFSHRIDTQILDENVCQLIESVWLESIGDLNKILSVSPERITLKTITEAEAALLELKLNNDSSAAVRFYSLIPHRPEYMIDLTKNRRALTEKIDLCQLLRDLLTVNELTNWNVKAPIEAKYRALNCHIETVDSSTSEFKNIADLIQSSTDDGEKIAVRNIFSVAKQADALNFRTSLLNQRQLFHGSKYSNFLGILSRGLALPKMVVEELGVERTDIGCLGYGLYFSDSVSTSLKYTTTSTSRPGRRLLCVCQVALCESANYYSFSPTLMKPPNGFHSTHGVKRTSENHSMFTDNEYAIYQLDQQRILYVVEVSWAPKDDLSIALERLPIVHHEQHALKLSEHAEVPLTIEDEVIEVTEQDYGLICPASGKLVPLKSFHIRAQIVDATAEVVLYQVYHNTSSIPIEAKYVFPLDENSTVCGFEAHINNKIIKGVVKEKEQAKQEYREAIEKGHGAYLMHQEQAQVFSVAVGNLPANNEVIIKITYVAELEIENGDIIFRIPAKMASWQSKQAIETKDQSTVRSIGIAADEKVEFSFKASLRMPYEIMKLFSPTHRLRRKLTDCMAMVELVDNVLIDRDFVLSITLKSANLPRISNETWSLEDDNGRTISNVRDSQACLLTFYPRFETLTTTNEQVEIVFIVDVSNSMDGGHVQQAKQLAHLFLTNLKVNDQNTYFNVVTFGSDNDECFPISTLATKENLDKAKHFVLHSLVHRGNTDLFAVIRRYSLLPPLPSSKLGRQFILLSDGHIHNLNSILSLFEHQSTMRHDRIFGCSIGDVANKHGLKQLARGATGGGLVTIFDSNYRSKWKTKVLSILEHARQPCVTSIYIDWHGNVDEEQKFHVQAPKMIRSLFNGMRLSVYRFIQNCHKATLTAIIDGQEFVTTVFSSTMTTTQGRILHCLTARAIIEDYENGLLHVDESENELIKIRCKQDLIDLSINFSVVSPYTSFVAIEERDAETQKRIIQPGVRLVDVMLDRDVDLLPYIEWDGDLSNLTIIKQKLLDGRISLDSASIQSKKESVTDIEKLCEKISYRAGGDAKFDMMMAIIRTYRYSLNDHDKADELENKMRQDIKNELLSATTEERQALEHRCTANRLIITSEEDSELEVDDDDDIGQIINYAERLSSMEELCNMIGEEIADDEIQASISSVGTISSSSSIKRNSLSNRVLESSCWASESTSSASSTECNELLYKKFLKTCTRQKVVLDSDKLKLNSMVSDDECEEMGFDLFGGFDVPSSAMASSHEELALEPMVQKAAQSVAEDEDEIDFSMLDCMDELSYIDFTENLQEKLSKKTQLNLKLQEMVPDTIDGDSNSFRLQYVQLVSPEPKQYEIKQESIISKPISSQPITSTTMNERKEKKKQDKISFTERVPSPSIKKMPSLSSRNDTRSYSTPPPPPPPPLPQSLTQKQPQSIKISPEEMELPSSRDNSQSYSAPPPPPPLPQMQYSRTSIAPGGRGGFSNRTMSRLVKSDMSINPFGASTVGGETQTEHKSFELAFPKSELSLDEISSRGAQLDLLSDGKCFGGYLSTQNNMNNNNSMFAARTQPMSDAFAPAQFNSTFAAFVPPPVAPPLPATFSSSLFASKQQFSSASAVSSSGFPMASQERSRSGMTISEANIKESVPYEYCMENSSLSFKNKVAKVSEAVREIGNSIQKFVAPTTSDQLDIASDELQCDILSLRKKKKTRRKPSELETASTPMFKHENIPISQTSICDLLLLDVCPLSLGIEDIHGHMHTLIRRNTTIPVRTELFTLFTNAYAYQTTATIRIFEGEHYLTKHDLFLGEFNLRDLTSNFASQTLKIAIRMDLDANGILRVDAEEAKSGAKASITITPGDQKRLSRDEMERHITYVESDASFPAKSVFDRKPDDRFYLLDGATETILHNFSGERAIGYGKSTDAPLLGKLKDIRFTNTMIEQLIECQFENGSFILNKCIADVFHIELDIFNSLENYLREQGFNSIALNVRDELLRLIGTGVILLWLILQIQPLQQNSTQLLNDIEQIKTNLLNHLPNNKITQINKAIEFYQKSIHLNGIYCKQLELPDSSWHMFIQHLLINTNQSNN